MARFDGVTVRTLDPTTRRRQMEFWFATKQTNVTPFDFAENRTTLGNGVD